ncbi:MAG: NYN domain-containing protein [Candidatus Niyogibacteria bacterium]|nr:NYN domain-containing protein [Candidatus Niyogibacteria bacterium]
MDSSQKKLRIAVVGDFDNLTIPIKERGMSIRWDALISEFSKRGYLSQFLIFMPYHCVPGNMSEIKEILRAIPYAMPVLTTEGMRDDDVTDEHIYSVAVSFLSDPETAPDILVIGSGDHYFAPLADLYEEYGKKVIIVSSMKQNTFKGLLRGSQTESFRDIIFLMKDEALENASPWVYKNDSQQVMEDEIRLLSRMIMREGKIFAKLRKNSYFQLVLTAYKLAEEMKSFNFKDFTEELRNTHKGFCGMKESYHDKDEIYSFVLQMLAGSYIEDGRHPALLVNRNAGYTWFEFAPGNDFGKRLEELTK